MLLELMQGEGAMQERLLGGYAILDPVCMVTVSWQGWWKAFQVNGAADEGQTETSSSLGGPASQRMCKGYEQRPEVGQGKK